ncbi:hypothetical protein AB0I28_15995 [Phytomonospora sp. NPDC050363]|uniref:hypothetical protein n=1 Tax=Phytomonospora sp. NPDC050363 TaxID=3155642 RepID=UPI003411A1A8
MVQSVRHETRTTTASGKRSIAVGGNADIDQSKRSTQFGGVLAVVAVIIVVAIIWGGIKIIGAVSEAVDAATLDADSTCEQFLLTDAMTRDEAVKRIGLELGLADAGHPWTVYNVAYRCGENPNLTLREAMA